MDWVNGTCVLFFAFAILRRCAFRHPHRSNVLSALCMHPDGEFVAALQTDARAASQAAFSKPILPEHSEGSE